MGRSCDRSCRNHPPCPPFARGGKGRHEIGMNSSRLVRRPTSSSPQAETIATLRGGWDLAHAIRLGIKPFAELGANAEALSGSQVDSPCSCRAIFESAPVAMLQSQKNHAMQTWLPGKHGALRRPLRQALEATSAWIACSKTLDRNACPHPTMRKADEQPFHAASITHVVARGAGPLRVRELRLGWGHFPEDVQEATEMGGNSLRARGRWAG